MKIRKTWVLKISHLNVKLSLWLRLRMSFFSFSKNKYTSLLQLLTNVSPSYILKAWPYVRQTHCGQPMNQGDW